MKYAQKCTRGKLHNSDEIKGELNKQRDSTFMDKRDSQAESQQVLVWTSANNLKFTQVKSPE